MSSITVTAYTDTGLQRDHNEDAVLVGGWICQTAVGSLVTLRLDFAAPFTCAVADGVGGRVGGELASRTALQAIADSSPSWRTSSDVAKSLIEANRAVREIGEKDTDLKGLSTTIAGVCVLDEEVIVFNIGDSRVYSIDAGVPRAVSIDDALVTPTGRQLNFITQSLGQAGSPSPHVQVYPRDGAAYLICTDGISGQISPEELSAATGNNGWRACARSLINSTLASGARDNLSLILLDVPSAALATREELSRRRKLAEAPTVPRLQASPRVVRD